MAGKENKHAENGKIQTWLWAKTTPECGVLRINKAMLVNEQALDCSTVKQKYIYILHHVLECIYVQSSIESNKNMALTLFPPF